MRKFFRWLFGISDEFDFKREFAKVIEAAPPVATIDLPPRAAINPKHAAAPSPKAKKKHARKPRAKR